MDRLKHLIIVFAALSLASVGWSQPQSSESTLRLFLDLTDGSRVVGVPSINSVSIQTPYARIDMPLTQIVSMAIEDDHETASLELRNGDKVTGVVTLEALEMTTIFGKVSIGVEHLTGLEVSLVSRALPQSLKSGLVLHYPFDEEEKERVTDKSGKKNHGKLGGATWTPNGRFGGAYEFDGSNDLIEIVSNPTSSESHTVAMWFTSSSVRNFKEVRQLMSYNRRYQMGARVIDDRVGFYSYCLNQPHYGASAVNVMSKPVTIKDNTWHHIALVVEGTGPTVRFYLDGKDIGSGSGSAVNTGNLQVLIGALNNDPTHGPRCFWQGSIDEVMIFDRALSARDVRLLHGLQGEE